MSCQIEVEIPSGHQAFGVSERGGPWLKIHIDALELSDEELGRAVRACGPAARLADACSTAEWIAMNSRYSKPWMIPADILEYESVLQEYASQDRTIDEALEIIARVRAYRENKGKKAQRRQEIRDDYDRLFVRIGRRDGFRCRHCGDSDNLAIDHITALALGGSNDFDNLQLLCGPCNSRKGID